MTTPRTRPANGPTHRPADRRTSGSGPRSARGVLLGVLTSALCVALAGCADVPPPAAAPTSPATAAPAVLADQAEHVRGEVAERLLAARVAGDPALLEGAATGPAALLQALLVRTDGPVPDATAEQPVPAAVVVAPRVDGWPRWFATLTDPSGVPAPGPSSVPGSVPPSDPAPSDPAPSDPAPSDPAPSDPAPSDPAPSGGPVVVPALPVLELYTSDSARLPYRLWGRLTMLPGAELPAFPAADLGAASLAGLPAPGTSVGPSDPGSVAPSGPAGPGDDGVADAAPGDVGSDAELLAAVDGLASRYASVMTDGDASPSAAEFEPDPFVEAVRARAAAEAAAVGGVADTTVTTRPLDGVEVLYAVRAANGDLLAVTAVETTVLMTVRPGAGVLRPGPELLAASGIEETAQQLTTRSVAALAFVVPAEQGAVRLVAVGEGLVSASAP